MHGAAATRTRRTLAEDQLDASVVQRFEEQVRRAPDRLALHTAREDWTYGSLNRAANRVAARVLELTGPRPEPVAIMMDSDAPMIAAILGVLKARMIYVPVDTSLPDARRRFIVDDSQARVIITDCRNRASAEGSAARACRVISFEDCDPSDTGPDPGLAISPDTPTWIIYTSGSTGQPKGVVQTHRNVAQYVKTYTKGFRISPDDRFSLLFAFSVNGAAHDMFSALLNGAALFPLNVKQTGVGPLAAWLTEHEITIYSSVPTIFRHFLDTLTGSVEFPHLRVIKLIGEPTSPRDVERFKARFSRDCVLVNRLGSTETGTIRWFFINKDTPIEGNVVPVGGPAEDHEVLLLDEAGAEVEPGSVGEIAVRSRYLTPGYWRRPDLTARAFLPVSGAERVYRTGDVGRLLPGGRLLCLGRKDLQVKIRGHRIEPAEIELALAGAPGVREAVVAVRNSARGEAQLVGYVVPDPSRGPTVTALRRHLAATLPPYMIPSDYIMLDRFPVASNGKVDRRALPAPNRARPALDQRYVAPRTAIEAILADIWAEILERDRVGVDDDFFDLGGDSLLAALAMARIGDAFQIELPVVSLFEAPSVAAMALALVQTPTAATSPGDRPDARSLLSRVQAGGSRRPFFFLHAAYGGDGLYCVNVARSLHPEQPFYGLRPHGRYGEAMPWTVEGMAASYVEVVRQVQPEGPYLLGGYCSSGIVAFEMACQLRDAGERVDLLALVEAPTEFMRWNIRCLRGMVNAWGWLARWEEETRLRHLSELWAQCQYYLRRVREVRGMAFGEQAVFAFKKVRAATMTALCARRGHDVGHGLNEQPDSRLSPSDVLNHYRRAVLGYTPRRYPGTINCFVARERTERRFEPHAWRRLATALDVREVPGDHQSCIVTAHVAELANGLRTCLETAQRMSEPVL
jgi:amino acid adenylation domain-containing protein